MDESLAHKVLRPDAPAVTVHPQAVYFAVRG